MHDSILVTYVWDVLFIWPSKAYEFEVQGKTLDKVGLDLGILC